MAKSTPIAPNSDPRFRQSLAQMASAVKANVSIPMYFYNIIVPQLGNYYDTYPVDFESRVTACCPLHDEDTPSFRYYESTSSFYCFGCQKGGDIVQLHVYYAERMNSRKITRDEAIIFLYNYFIDGKESTEFVGAAPQQIQDEKLNTDTDITKFNLYRYNLEASITNDKSIPLEIKKQFWKILDNIDILLTLNKVKADECEKRLKAKVKELITIDTTQEQSVVKIKPKSN